jgi:hypothetical protein
MNNLLTESNKLFSRKRKLDNDTIDDVDFTSNQSDFDSASSCSSHDDDSSQAIDDSSIFVSTNSKKWSVEEDRRLQTAISLFGESRWRNIAEIVGTRDHGKFY